MKKIILSALVCVISSTLSAQIHHLDSVQKEKIHLNDIIIQGDFRTDPIFSVEVIHQHHQTVQPKNVADLFKDVDGMNFIKRGNYAIDPSFRAAQYEELNVQYDGGVKAMHACPNRMDPVTTHVLPEEIEKIEIIKGPYSVRYGSNFAGVINMVTSKPGLENQGLSGTAKAGFESNGNTWLTAAGLQYAGNQFHVKGNVGYRDFGNYQDGNGVDIPSAFKSTDYAVGAGFSPNHKHHIMAQFRQSFGRDVLHAGLPMDTEIDNSSILSFDYYVNHLDGILNQFNFKAYYATVDHLMSNTNRPNFMMAAMESHVYADTYGGKLEAQWQPSKKWNVFTGLDLYAVEREGTKQMLKKKDMQGNPILNPMLMKSDVWQDSKIQDYGIFAESNYQILSNLVLKNGLRADFVYAEPTLLAENFEKIYGNVGKLEDINISGHIGLKFEPKPKEIWEIAIGRGVRSANMIERYINYFTVGQDAFNYVGNPHLKPEINHQIEVGYKNTLYTSNATMLDTGFSAYYSDMQDYITAVVNTDLTTMMAPNVKQFINVKEAYRTGFEAYLNTTLYRHWNLGTVLSYVYTKNKTLNEALPLTPPFTAKLDAHYTNPKWNVGFNWNLLAAQKQIATSFAEVETPGYGVLDFDLIYRPVPNFSIGAAVLNIFDKAYHNHQNFSFVNQTDFSRVPINEPGRNFTIFTQYNF